jgi:hypothetical protein
MFRNLSYSYKNKLLIFGMILLLLLSWNLALKKTYEAILLNRQLSKANQEANNLSSNPEYLKRKAVALTHILNRYQVDSSEWKNGFWLNVSAVVANRGLEVIYQPEKNSLVRDSASTELKQSIQFRGEFKGLVQLLDSMERSKGLGKIVSARFEKEKRDFSETATEKIILKTDFRAIQK